MQLEYILQAHGFGGGKVASLPVGEVKLLYLIGEDGLVKIFLEDAEDVVLNDVIYSKWEKTVVVRKAGSASENIDDGTIVFSNTVRNQYKETPFQDTNVTNGVEYFYTAYSISETKAISNGSSDSVVPTELTIDTWIGVRVIVRAGLANEYFTVGDQLASDYNGGEIIWQVIGIDADTPTDDQYQHSMTIQTKDCLEDRMFDSGNDNRYLNSPIREYLNSEFLSKLDPELSAVLGEVDKKVAKKNDLGGGQDSFSDKVFLLSRVEVDLGIEGTTTGETVYPFYDGKGNANRIKNLNNSARDWWLRSPNVSGSDGVRRVDSGGSLSNRNAISSYGLSPACAIV